MEFLVRSKLREIEDKNTFFDQLSKIAEQYSIENNVFGWSRPYMNKPGECKEINEGYYIEIKKIENLDDVREEFNITKNLIRIQNEDFYLGEWRKNLDGINEGYVIDLDKKTVI